nr:immunoglobulin heavy chain junction region [Mus musculus]
SIIVQDMITPL